MKPQQISDETRRPALYFAPMEGFTGYVFRQIHHKHFPGIDKYFTPFITANQTFKFYSKDKRDLEPENNSGLSVCPQIMTKNVEQFLWAAGEIKALGYHEVNINLGCPSATVTTKGKGAGMLNDPEALDRFLDAVFEKTPIEISVKTRLGFDDPEEFEDLLKIFNRYPIRELIIHPRIRNDFYNGTVREEWFMYAYENSTNPLVFNGDIRTIGEFEQIRETYSQLNAVMIGRGFLENPALGREITGGASVTDEEFRTFLADLFETYTQIYGSDKTALNRMKDIWYYVGVHRPGAEKAVKKIKKAKDAAAYNAAVNAFFALRDAHIKP